VETPADAIRCFLSCNLDVLYLPGYRLTKYTIEAGVDATALVPCLTDDVTLSVTYASEGGAAVGPNHHWQSRTGHRTALAADDFALLSAIDARRTIGELAAMSSKGDVAEVTRAIAGLQRTGLICLAGSAGGS
jgi:carbamoyltransferase